MRKQKVFELLLVCSFANSCQRDFADVATIDNFSAGGERLRGNVCSADLNQQQLPERNQLRGQIRYPDAVGSAVDATVVRVLTAAPPVLQSFLAKDLGVKIMVSQLSSTLCTKAFDAVEITTQDDAVSCSVSMSKEMFARLDSKLQTELTRIDPSSKNGLYWVMISPAEPEIEFGLIRQLGYLLSQGLDLDADANVIHAKSALLTAYLEDLQNPAKSSYLTTVQRFGLDPFQPRDDVNAKLAEIADYVFAETFDSYFCNNWHSDSEKNTLSVLANEFPKTFAAFPAAYNTVVAAANPGHASSKTEANRQTATFALADATAPSTEVKLPVAAKPAALPPGLTGLAPGQTPPSSPTSRSVAITDTHGPLKKPQTLTNSEYASAWFGGFTDHFKTMGSSMVEMANAMPSSLGTGAYPTTAAGVEAQNQVRKSQQASAARVATGFSTAYSEGAENANRYNQQFVATGQAKPLPFSPKTISAMQFIPGATGAATFYSGGRIMDPQSPRFGKPADMVDLVASGSDIIGVTSPAAVAGVSRFPAVAGLKIAGRTKGLAAAPTTAATAPIASEVSAPIAATNPAASVSTPPAITSAPALGSGPVASAATSPVLTNSAAPTVLQPFANEIDEIARWNASARQVGGDILTTERELQSFGTIARAPGDKPIAAVFGFWDRGNPSAINKLADQLNSGGNVVAVPAQSLEYALSDAAQTALMRKGALKVAAPTSFEQSTNLMESIVKHADEIGETGPLLHFEVGGFNPQNMRARLANTANPTGPRYQALGYTEQEMLAAMQPGFFERSRFYLYGQPLSSEQSTTLRQTMLGIAADRP